MTKISLSDFSILYDEMMKLRNITELKEIQRLKSLLYEIVHDYNGENKRVFNLLEDEEGEGNEIVVAFGRASHLMSATGLVGLKSEQVFEDLLFGTLKGKFKNASLVEFTLPNLLKGNSILPVNKYLRKVNREKMIIDEKVLRMEEKEPIDLLTNSILNDINNYENDIKHFDSLELIFSSELSDNRKLNYIVMTSISCEVAELRSFLCANYENIKEINTTILRKLICILDMRENKNNTQQG